MSEDQISEYHEQYLKRKALYQSFGYDVDSERNFVLEQAKPIHGKILEAGTGKGHFALALAKAGYSFVTFDISQEEQRFARLSLTHFGLEHFADFHIENGEHTSFASGSFDVIFSVNVLHHLQNPYRFFDEMLRLLSSRGKIILADFTPEGFCVMERIHRCDGQRHEVGKIAIEDAKKYFSEKHCMINEAKSTHQHVAIITRKPDHL